MALAGPFPKAADDHVVLAEEATDSGTQPSDEWETHRDEITRLYTCGKPKRTLKNVQTIMKDVHGFDQPERQYKKYLAMWDVKKSITREQVMAMLEKEEERWDTLGKATKFTLNGQPVDARKHRTTKRCKLDFGDVKAADVDWKHGPLRCWTPPMPDNPRSVTKDGGGEDSNDVSNEDVNIGDCGDGDAEGFDIHGPIAEEYYAEDDQATVSYSDLFHTEFLRSESDRIESDHAELSLIEDIFEPIPSPGTNGGNQGLKPGVEHPHAPTEARQPFQPNRPDRMWDCMSQISHKFSHLSVWRPSFTPTHSVSSGKRSSSITSWGDAGMHALRSLASYIVPVNRSSPLRERLDAQAIKLDNDAILFDLKWDPPSKGCNDRRLPAWDTAVEWDHIESPETNIEVPEADEAGECPVLVKDDGASGVPLEIKLGQQGEVATCENICGFGPLHRAILRNDLPAVNRLLEGGADPGGSCKRNLNLGFPEDVPEAAEPTYLHILNPSLLHFAAFVGNEKIVAALLAWGATEPKVQGRLSAAELASRLQRKPIVAILLENHWWHTDTNIEWLMLYAAGQGHLTNVTACCTMLEADIESGKLLILREAAEHNAPALPGAHLPSQVGDLLLVTDKQAYLSCANLHLVCTGLIRKQ